VIKKIFESKKVDDISGATAAFHLSILPTNKIIHFLHRCLPSTMLTISHLPSSCPYYSPTHWMAKFTI